MAKWLAMLVLAISLVCWALTRLSAASHRTDNEPHDTVQIMVPQNLNGTYAGKVYLSHKNNKKRFIMLGPALLEIKGKTFSLCKSIKDDKGTVICTGTPITGEISFSTIPEKADLGVGSFQPKTDDPIETRWYRDAKRNIFKIVRANAAKRYFRFCSNINDVQCFGKI
jgi:hypothetical protein